MASMSIRGLNDKALFELRRRAEREGSSLNSLVVRLLQGEDTQTRRRPVFDDLDALAGTWSAQDQRAFERQTAPFSEVDAALWK